MEREAEGGQTYAVVETEEGVVAEDMEEGIEHSLRTIVGACLEADLC